MLSNSINALDPNTYRTADDTTGLFMQPKKSTELGRDQFMALLVKQMETQDPLEPMKDEQFVAQLATFSSLEQLTDLNKRMDSLITGQQSMVNSQSLSMIGRQVLADTGGVMRLSPTGADTVSASFDEAPALARVEIKDANGKLVRTLQIDKPVAGMNKVQWDGKDEHGNRLADGDYNFSVITANAKGDLSTAKGYVSMLVDGIHVGADGIQLMSGGRVVNFSKVIEISVPPTVASTGTASAAQGGVGIASSL